MRLNEIRHALKARPRHAEGALATRRVEVRLAFKTGSVELCNPLEGCEAEIGLFPSPELSLVEENVVGECVPSERGAADESGVVERGFGDEGGAGK